MNSEQKLKRFSSNLKKLRLQQRREDGKPWTQTDLGYESGMEPNFISKLERGASEPGFFTILALCHALSCTPNDLML